MAVVAELMRARLEILRYFLKGYAKACLYNLGKEPVMTSWLEVRIRKEAQGEENQKITYDHLGKSNS